MCPSLASASPAKRLRVNKELASGLEPLTCSSYEVACTRSRLSYRVR
jgi:hypothetical protein